MKQTDQEPVSFNRRILLDVSVVITLDANTGIQRVVRNICREAEFCQQEHGVQVIPVSVYGDQLLVEGYDLKLRWDEKVFRGVTSIFRKTQDLIAGALNRVRNDSGDQYLGLCTRLRKLLFPKTIFRKLGHSYKLATRKRVEPGENDTLVLLDASWNIDMQQLLEKAKSRNTKILTTIYDLIPVRHPEFHELPLRKLFSKWLERVTAHSDCFIGISDTVKEELKAYVREQVGRELPAEMFQSFRLGADFAGTSREKEDADLAIASKRSVREAAEKETHGSPDPEDFYLAVGTIEPRKNHKFLLDAFERLWNTNQKASLVIVGRKGWMCDHVVKRIENHPQLGKQLHYFDDACDATLNELYSNAKALVFPSIVEGFGLPIVEALHHGVPVLASDTQIHREVGGDLCSYFDLDDVNHLVEMLRDIESGRQQLVQPENFSVTSWQESCEEFISKTLQFSDYEATAIPEKQAA